MESNAVTSRNSPPPESADQVESTLGGGQGLGLVGHDVSMAFTTRRRATIAALSEVSLDVPRGEFVAIVGPSGCGKTTLLRIFAGLTMPTGGRVLIDGQEVAAPREDVSIMFQTPTLLPWRRSIDNCLLPIDIHRRVQEADRERAYSLLHRSGLAGFEKSYPAELSGGMQQRVAICRSLIGSPSVLLLDEPFGALDAMTRDQMNLDLHAIWSANRVTTLLITHSIPEAVFLAQRVIVMAGAQPGHIVDTLTVPLPDRRDADVMESREFGEFCAQIRSYFTRRGTDDH